MEKIEFARPYMDESEVAAASEVIRSGWIVNGPRLKEFEKQFAEICGAQHAVGVSSWTTGAFLLMHSLGIIAGDEVIVPSFTFIASVNVIKHLGATPVFADINPRTLNIDPCDVVARITHKTKAVMSVDQLGFPADTIKLREVCDQHGLMLLQDAACSFGSELSGKGMGATSEFSIFSLHARKIISTAEGGMITVNDASLAERLRRLRQQGMSVSDYSRHVSAVPQFEVFDEIGYNFRMTDIQAAIGISQLAKLEEILRLRHHAASFYNQRLSSFSSLDLVDSQIGAVPNWQSYSVTLNAKAPISRDSLIMGLAKKGVPTKRGVMACHLQRPYLGRATGLPHTEHVSRNSLLLPMHPALSDHQLTYIVEQLAILLEESQDGY